MKSKKEWSDTFGDYKSMVGGIENVSRRISPEMVKQIQKDALEEAAQIVAYAGLVGEAVKKIYARIEKL